MARESVTPQGLIDSNYGNKQLTRVIIAKIDTDFISILITNANILYHRA